MPTTELIEILRQDYQRFPQQQTFSIYAADVYFQDPLNQFRGVERYQKVIQFIQTWFIDTHMDLHALQQVGDLIHSRWTLSWRSHPQSLDTVLASSCSLATPNGDFWSERIKAG